MSSLVSWYSCIRQYVAKKTLQLQTVLLLRTLKRHELLDGLVRIPHRDGEPFFIEVSGRKEGKGRIGGGISLELEEEAALKALAEVLERHVWYNAMDCWERRVVDAYINLSKNSAVSPFRFAGFSEEQRAHDERLQISDSSLFTWIQGQSWVTGGKTLVPLQTVSGAYDRTLPNGTREKAIRSSTTCGVAVGPTRESAVLSGALELIERDAFLIMWLNQLTLPRFDLNRIRETDGNVEKLVSRCEEKGIVVHVVSLLTDAPTHAVCVILEDTRDIAPRFSLGLSAGPNLSQAVVKAGLEALRARVTSHDLETLSPTDSVSDEYIHLTHWYPKERSGQLAFLVQGKTIPPPEAAWEKDNTSEHLARVNKWCAEKEYEFVSVSLTKSRLNPTSLHIESVVIPELIPFYVKESHPHYGPPRLTDIPREFGYSPRINGFETAPHPFR